MRQNTKRNLRFAGILTVVFMISFVLALLPQSVQAATLTTTVTVGNGAGGVAVTPNGSYVYVTNYYANTVSVISTATNTVNATITGFNYPNSVAVTPNGSYVYVTNYNGNTVSVISTATNTVNATITGFNYPNSVAVSPNGSYVYVSNYYGNTVSVISTATNTVTSTITGLNYAEAVAVSPNGEFIYVKHSYDQNQVLFSVINTTTNTVTATVTLNGYPNFSSGGGSSSVAVAPDGKSIYVASTDYSIGNLVSVINATTNTVTATITLGGRTFMDESGSGGVAITPNGAYAYATSSDYMNGNSVSVISTSTNTVTETVLLGESFYYMGGGSGGVAITPNGAYAYVTSGGYMSSTVSVLSTSGIDTFAISVSQSSNGVISPGTTTVDYGAGQEFTFTPATGYHLVEIIVNGTTVATTSPYNISDVTGPTSLTAEYAVDVFTITVGDHTNGSITSTNGTTTNYGNNLNFTITPNTGYHLISVLIDGETATTPYNFINVTANHTISATFAIDTFTITVGDHTNGSITSTNGTTTNYGNNLNFTITPNTGYHLISVLIDGETATTPYNFINVTANHTISATFAIDTFTITVGDHTNGSITSTNGTTTNYGNNLNFTITPNTGYHLISVLIDGETATTPYNFNNVTANHTISATFAIDTFTITVSQGANGVISAGTTTVDYGAGQEFTFTPATGYHLLDVLINGTSVIGDVENNGYTVSNVTGATTLSATYAIDTFAITITQGNHGTISPENATVNYGSEQEFTFTPATGYHLVAIKVNGTTVGTTSPYTISDVTGATSLTAEYAINTYAITITQGANGVISLETLTVNYGSDNVFTITAVTGYHIVDVVVDGVSKGTVTSWTFSNVTAVHTITASFAINTYAISITQGANGLISGSTSVNYGADATYTITPATGYRIVNVIIDGVSKGAFASYTISYVQSTHTVTAIFAVNIDAITATVTTTGTTYGVGISGNVTAHQMSNVTITPHRLSTSTIVSFTVTGPSGTIGFGNITLSKSAIPFGTSPVVYIDGSQALNQGYTQDADNFYVWYTTSFSTHEMTILFTSTPHSTPTSTPNPTESSMSLSVPVIAAMILIGLVLIGLLVKRRRKQQNTQVFS